MAERTMPVTVSGNAHLVAPMAIIVVLILILVPLPPGLLDFFFTLNIVISVGILLISTYIKDPVDFSVYPTILLLATLYRLALNISSTRLILLHGDNGVNAAGKVIGAFGQFVIGGSYLIGIVVFVIIVAIQKIVVAAGAGRASEVAARFTLDKMPGKQMSSDADLNAGLITEQEAKDRRRRIEQEAEFYGSMDGAIKFTTNEATVSIIITMVNIIGGILVGMFQKGMPFEQAGSVYTVMTIGDGLMAAVPSLLVTISGGIITTRAASNDTLGEDLVRQTLFNAQPIMIAGAAIGALGLVPGLPLLPFALIGGSFAYMARQIQGKQKTAEVRERQEQEKIQQAPPPEKIESLLKVDLLGLEIGYSLIPLVDQNQGGTLLTRIKAMRRQLALEMGLIVPPVRIRDNLQLGSREYAVLIKGVPVVKGEVLPNQFLAINPGNVTQPLKGMKTREPAFGLEAWWVGEQDREQAQFLGYTLVDPATVITTHVTEVIKAHAHEILGRQETQHLLDNLGKTYPRLVEDLVPGTLSLGQVQKVLQNLLRERVSIFDLRTILECLADYGPSTKDTGQLTEFCRQALGRGLIRPYLTGGNDLPVLVLGGALEQDLNRKIQILGDQPQLVIQPDEAQRLIEAIRRGVDKAGLKVQPILLCSSLIRPHLHQLLERFLPNLVVLSAAEVPASVRVVSLGVIEG